MEKQRAMSSPPSGVIKTLEDVAEEKEQEMENKGKGMKNNQLHTVLGEYAYFGLY